MLLDYILANVSIAFFLLFGGLIGYLFGANEAEFAKAMTRERARHRKAHHDSLGDD